MKKREVTGVVPVQYDNDQSLFRVWIIQNHSGDWIFPKGGVECYLGKKASAMKEAYEEAGLLGRASTKLFRYERQKDDVIERITLYRMDVFAVLEVYPEVNMRERRLVSFKVASRLLSKQCRTALRALEWYL